MNNYKITIQYDGTRYKGWQGQNSTGLTIQGKIEAVLGQMAGHAVEVIGSGRTDAGVHAKGQVANFHIEEHFTEGKILSYLNHYLPDDIAVIAVEQVDERFHSRYAAKKKSPTAITSIWERSRMFSSGNMSTSMRKHSMWNA